MRSRLEVECEMARSIATGLLEDFAEFEQRLPPSKRGSNLQRVMDRMKGRAEGIVQCLDDGVNAGGQP